MPTTGVVILAGGAARRLGGVAKPSLPVGGVPLLRRVLAAVDPGAAIVVVGPPELSSLLPAGVTVTREEPAGGGPAWAARAGVRRLGAAAGDGDAGPARLVPARLSGGDGAVFLLAADLPFLTPDALSRLRRALRVDLDGAVLVDPDGRPQWLAGVWWSGPLGAALEAATPGASLRSVLAPLRVGVVAPAAGPGAPAWFDCDTDEDLRRAEEWTRADPG